jgi:hypothetical protein
MLSEQKLFGTNVVEQNETFKNIIPHPAEGFYSQS